MAEDAPACSTDDIRDHSSSPSTVTAYTRASNGNVGADNTEPSGNVTEQRVSAGNPKASMTRHPGTPENDHLKIQ